MVTPAYQVYWVPVYRILPDRIYGWLAMLAFLLVSELRRVQRRADLPNH